MPKYLPGCYCEFCEGERRKEYFAGIQHGKKQTAYEARQTAYEALKKLNEEVDFGRPQKTELKKEDLLNTYPQFVEDMTLAQVNSLRSHLQGLVAEVGELAGKVYKADRDNRGKLDAQGMLMELGDILFYLTGIGNKCGWSLMEIIIANKAKLNSRKAMGTIQGSGDKR